MTTADESVTQRPDYKRKRGELRIYLGAAPGVGKTYAMLGEAHRRLERGTDWSRRWWRRMAARGRRS